jgi:hypothetical protein
MNGDGGKTGDGRPEMGDPRLMEINCTKPEPDIHYLFITNHYYPLPKSHSEKETP